MSWLISNQQMNWTYLMSRFKRRYLTPTCIHILKARLLKFLSFYHYLSVQPVLILVTISVCSYVLTVLYVFCLRGVLESMRVITIALCEVCCVPVSHCGASYVVVRIANAGRLQQSGFCVVRGCIWQRSHRPNIISTFSIKFHCTYQTLLYFKYLLKIHIKVFPCRVLVMYFSPICQMCGQWYINLLKLLKTRFYLTYICCNC